MYETIEHWKQYKQNNKSMKMTPFLIKLQKEKAIKEMDKFITKLVNKNGTTKY